MKELNPFKLAFWIAFHLVWMLALLVAAGIIGFQAFKQMHVAAAKEQAEMLPIVREEKTSVRDEQQQTFALKQKKAETELAALPKAEENPRTNAVQEETTETPKASSVIIGSTKEQVDILLPGWSCRKSDRSTVSRPLYYYTKDVEIIVTFSGGTACGAAVIDRPGRGSSPISESRYSGLLKLIGGGSPKLGDITRDRKGIREFSVGDAD
jgi:hypothetical protein